MKKHLFVLAMAFVALCTTFASCTKDPVDEGNDTPTDNPASVSKFVGVYDLDMVYDSITTSDGTWFDNEFFETMTGKTNPPEHGYLTIAEGQNGKLNVTATFVKENEEKVFFSTTATEDDDMLTLDDCTSDYYYATTEEMIRFTFHGFDNRMPEIYFKGIYTINLGADYSYLNSYTCVKR